MTKNPLRGLVWKGLSYIIELLKKRGRNTMRKTAFMARGAVSDTLTQSCLESLYGQICQLRNDVIIPKRNACA